MIKISVIRFYAKEVSKSFDILDEKPLFNSWIARMHKSEL